MASAFKKLKNRLFKKYRVTVRDVEQLKQTYQKDVQPVHLYALISIPIVLILAILLFFYIKMNNSSVAGLDSNNNVSAVNYKKQVIELNKQVEVLEEKLQTNNQYIESLRSVMAPNKKGVKLDTVLRSREITEEISQDELLPTKADSILREQVAKEEWGGINLNPTTNNVFEGLLFPPLKGVVTAGYNISENHLAVDIAAKEGESIKAAANGTVLFTDFTTETGYVIIIHHNQNLITVYKHNSIIYKTIGEYVEKGEVIGAVGNTGELTTGPHLHFEVWLDGKQVNPETYVDL